MDYSKVLSEENQGLVLLTDEEENPKKIAKNCMKRIRGIELIIGENLSYENEKFPSILLKIGNKCRTFEMNVCICKKGENYAYL
ncbi:cobalt-precorrin-6Y C(5)-methyltransferase [Fusobacterium necrophorum subsp. necrophorum]|nr:cobalt-precorrin-6Y C(5)-methyltransferase [Fusobacterium necrophorum subsp. necrophorum]